MNPILNVIVKIWFDKVNGNTYHNVITRLANALRIESGLTYGYDRQYEQTLKTLLKRIGCNIDDYRVFYEVINVNTKRELKACKTY